MTSTSFLSREPWGTLSDGRAVQRFTLRNAAGMRVTVSDLGATLLSWHAPDRAGRLDDILLGHDTPADYLASNACMGGLIGRWANRVAGARFELDGVGYALERNENGNLLHSGSAGFHRALWSAREDEAGLLLQMASPAGSAGFPGRVEARVRYALADDGTLTIAYEATSDAPTPLNLTNHAYFNLGGAGRGDIRGHVVTIDADAFFEVDEQLIPQREAPVAGSAFDFRQEAPVGARLDWPHAQLARAGGFDHCYVLRDSGANPPREVARAYEPGSGRELVVLTDQRGLQFYTGNQLSGERLRGGMLAKRYDGLCFEASAFPNEVNMPSQARVILRPGQVYRQRTQYRVGPRAA